MSTGIIDLVVFILVLEVLAFSVLPLVAWMLPRAPDRGYGLSKIAGLFMFGLLSWIIPALGLAPATEGLVRVVFTVTIVTGYLGYARALLSIEDCKRLVRSHAVFVEGLFVGLTVVLSVIRFFNPEIVWGEKPMDSTFLHFLVRTDTIPPQDPWAAGHVMRYYYLGIYFMAEVLELTGIPVAIGYNLAIASLGGLIASALYTLFALLTRSSLFSVVAAALVVMGSNPEVLNICMLNGREASFDTFWASARLFTSPCFFEYTSWSLLFADLHAHVIAIPITVLALTLAVSLFGDGGSRYTTHGLALRLFLGLVLGIIFGANSWDFISYGGVSAGLVLFAQVPTFWKPPIRSDGTVAFGEKVFAGGFARSVALVWDGVICLITALPLVWLYSHASGANGNVGTGFVTLPEFNDLGQILRALGYLIVAGFAGLSAIAVMRVTRRDGMRLGAILGACTTLGVLCYAVISSGMHIDWSLPWGIVAFSGLLVVALWLILWGSPLGWEGKAITIIGSGAACLIMYCEVFYLIDRMNTVFKGYMAVWMFMAVSSLTVAYHAYVTLFRSGNIFLSRALGTLLVVLAMLTTMGSMLNVKGVIKMQRINKRTYTLDGTRYLEEFTPDEAKLIKWLNESVRGTPTMLEAQGPSYREYTRISMFTGIPTVLGWEYHVQQRGLPQEELQRRKADIETIYSNRDPQIAASLLKRHRVDLIVVSDVERATYEASALAKFDRHPELFIPLFASGRSKVYGTYFSQYAESK